MVCLRTRNLTGSEVELVDFAIRRGPSPCCGSTWVWEPAGSRTAGSPRSPCSLPHTRPPEPGRRVPCLRAPPADLPGTASAPSAPRLPPSSCHGTRSSRPLAVSLSLHPPPASSPRHPALHARVTAGSVLALPRAWCVRVLRPLEQTTAERVASSISWRWRPEV